jgi:hypothetical protein
VKEFIKAAYNLHNCIGVVFQLHRITLKYFFNIPTHAHTTYTLKSTKIHIKKPQKLAPTCFGPIFKTIFRGPVDSTLSSYQVDICWYTFVIELCGLRPYVITIHLYMCLVFLTEWNLVMEYFEDGLKNETETCSGKFLSVLMWILVLFKVYIVCMCWNIKEITEATCTHGTTVKITLKYFTTLHTNVFTRKRDTAKSKRNPQT